MRFDDRLATALGQAAETPAARQATWRQLVDLLGQAPDVDPVLRSDALDRLRAWRSEVPPSSRQSAAIMLARHDVPADLVELFAEDLTAVGAPLLAVVQLPGEEWAAMIPRLSPVARALLRHRRDLPPAARMALEAYGPADLVIPAPAGSVPEPQTDEKPDIQTLRARVDAVLDARRNAVDASLTPAPVPVTGFDYETGPDGILVWCDLPHRGAVLGLSIADPAGRDRSGVDGQAAGAFRQRAPFRNARLWIAHGTAQGDWTLSGVPNFDPASGRFLGYRGSARRPQLCERADPPGLLGLGLPGDSARQFAHEVRTPLNAIAGFAEMIQRQMLGPVSGAYRDQASAIMDEAKRIGSVLDELEEAARLESGALPTKAEQVDCALMVARIASALGPAAAEKGVLLALSIAPQCAAALADPTMAERLAVRLLSTCVGMAGRGEQLEVEVAPAPDATAQTSISVSRPRCLESHAEDALFDACDVDDADEEPPLGFGFTMRFVRASARACGGRLAIDKDRFRLVFAAAQPAQERPTDEEAAADWTEWLRRQSAAGACQEERASAIAADLAGPVAQR